MHDLRVDVATKNDIPAVMHIASVCKLSRWSEKDLLAEIELERSVFLRLLDSDDNCIGFIIGRVVPGMIRDWDADLYNIGILPNSQKNGGGSLLLSAFSEKVAQLGARSIWLDVRVSNHNAIGFYTSLGFIKEGIRRNFYADPVEDALLMNLVLTDTSS